MTAVEHGFRGVAGGRIEVGLMHCSCRSGFPRKTERRAIGDPPGAGAFSPLGRNDPMLHVLVASGGVLIAGVICAWY